MVDATSEQFVVDGLSAGVVRHTGGVFRSISKPLGWVEDAFDYQPKKSTFHYLETKRSRSGILLYDSHRKMNVLLDLQQRCILIKAGHSVLDMGELVRDFEPAGRIIDATAPTVQSMFEITGLTLGVLTHESGVFRRTGSGDFWIEQDPRGNIRTSYLEVRRTIDTVTIQTEDMSHTVIFDFLTRSIRSRRSDAEEEAVTKFGIAAIAEPLGVILEDIRVILEDDAGEDEELYGRFHTHVSGANASAENSKERELLVIEKPLRIKKDNVHDLVDSKVLMYGVDRNNVIYVAGWLKERDIGRDDELGFQQSAVPVEHLHNEEQLVLPFQKGKTKVEVHIRVVRNYFNFVSRQDGFVALEASDGVHYVPRFAGVVPMPHNKVKGIDGGVNVLPEGPESVSNRLRSVVILGIGIVPYVGGVVSGVVDLLWGEEEIDAWDEIKERAESLVKNLIISERVRDLGKRLQGLKNTIDAYQNASAASSEKGSWIVNVISSLYAIQPFFFDERNPEVMLHYVVALGTLTLAVLREQIVSYKTLFGQDDPKAEYKLEQMKRQSNKFRAAAEKAAEGAMRWRMNLVHVIEDSGKFTVKDNLADYTSERYNEYPEGLYDNVKESARNSFEIRLADVIHPVETWNLMIPNAEKKNIGRQEMSSVSGPFPVAKWSGKESPLEGGRISRLKFAVDGFVRGVEVWHGEKLGLHCGDMSKGEETQLELDSDEYIIAASGRSEEKMLGMWLFTSKGRGIGGGKQSGGFAWTAAPPSLDGYLEGMFIQKGGLVLRWRYWAYQ